MQKYVPLKMHVTLLYFTAWIVLCCKQVFSKRLMFIHLQLRLNENSLSVWHGICFNIPELYYLQIHVMLYFLFPAQKNAKTNTMFGMHSRRSCVSTFVVFAFSFCDEWRCTDVIQPYNATIRCQSKETHILKRLCFGSIKHLQIWVWDEGMCERIAQAHHITTTF